jgi:hypothetical protein
MEYVESYLDDLILTNLRFKDHLLKLETVQVLATISTSGIIMNTLRSKLFEKIEYVGYGYWIIRQGIQPIRKKVKDISTLRLPK